MSAFVFYSIIQEDVDTRTHTPWSEGFSTLQAAGEAICDQRVHVDSTTQDFRSTKQILDALCQVSPTVQVFYDTEYEVRYHIVETTVSL